MRRLGGGLASKDRATRVGTNVKKGESVISSQQLEAIGLGLEFGAVKLVPGNSEWLTLGKEMAEDIYAAIKDIDPAAQVEHVGSTSVPLNWAKPIIDLSLGITRWDVKGRSAVRAALRTLGWEAIFRVNEGDLLCALETEEGLTVGHLHLVALGSPQWETYLAFKQLLQNSEEARAAYLERKLYLAGEFKDNRREYTNGKRDLIEGLLK